MAEEQDFFELQAIRFQEVGSVGLEITNGLIQQAYNAELQWPAAYEHFNRLRRSDPEVTIVRVIFAALSRNTEFIWTPGSSSPTAGDEAAADFANEVMADLEGGPRAFVDTIVSHLPFMGWTWNTIVPAVRRPEWKPPGGSRWRSQYDDGRIGIRKLAWRDHSSLKEWAIDEATGELRGMVQLDYPNPEITLPLEDSLHLTFGDNNSPEGLSPLEALWRLERIKYTLEIIQGMGFEHASGHVHFQTGRAITPADKAIIAAAAKSILTAKEGNFAITPEHISMEVKDVTFSAAEALLEAIRFYSILKLQLYFAQWVAVAATSGSGSFAAKADDSSMFQFLFNSMLEGIAEQVDQQLGPWLFSRANPGAFPGMTARPVLKTVPSERDVDLSDLGQFVQSVFPLMETTVEDWLAVRKKSGFLPEMVPRPDDRTDPEPDQEEEPAADGEEEEPAAEEEEQETGAADGEDGRGELITPFLPPAGEPINAIPDPAAINDPAELEELRRRLRAFSERESLNLDRFLEAQPEPEPA